MAAFVTSITPPFTATAQHFVVADDLSLKTPISSADSSALVTAGYSAITLTAALVNLIPVAH
jgi:hypothetical protein